MDTSEFSPTELRLIALWEEHTRLEFEARDAIATVATMSDDNYVNHVPVMTGGRGKEEMLDFYGNHFIPKMPSDTKTRLICRTVGQGRVIDELVMSFTHDVEMDWMTPGIPPTGRKVEVPLVVVVETRADKIVCERIYWDQASVLLQLGMIESGTLPVAGAESAQKAIHGEMPSNELIRRASG